jgi:hypothetical protein
MRSQLRPESPRSCVFCGRRPLTREHIFPLWLRDAVGGVGVATNYMTDGGEAWPAVGEPLAYQRQWRANEAGIVARCVCGECNNGWMNDLDHEVKERLVPLVGGAAEEIDAETRQRLATWAAKIGILLENTRGVSDLTRRRAMIPPKRQRELFELRLPPSCLQIWRLVADVAGPARCVRCRGRAILWRPQRVAHDLRAWRDCISTPVRADDRTLRRSRTAANRAGRGFHALSVASERQVRLAATESARTRHTRVHRALMRDWPASRSLKRPGRAPVAPSATLLL